MDAFAAALGALDAVRSGPRERGARRGRTLLAIVDAYDDAAVEGTMRALCGRDDAGGGVAALARRRARCDEGAARAAASDSSDDAREGG